MTDNAGEAATCPVCHGELIQHSGQEFCPACLLQQGIRSSTLGGSRPAWTPPPIEQIAKSFPGLEILSLLGQGGMGAVYKVRQLELERVAALKVLPEQVAQEPGFQERFLREARLLASLSHPHIVTVYEFGQRNGVYFLLMEYVDGVTLRQALRSEPIHRLSPHEALTVVGQLCDALQFAHDEGVIHRDIKPENILIDKRGRVKIADFGLARMLGRSAGMLTLTGTNQLLGTPIYMAPEQIEGVGSVDHRADIYSMGVVFYELLTGELPIGRFSAPSMRAELDARLDEVVLRTLEKEPDRRYQQASEVRSAVETITRPQVAAPSTSTTGIRRFVPASLRVPVAFAAGVALMVFLPGLIGWIEDLQRGTVNAVTTTSPSDPPFVQETQTGAAGGTAPTPGDDSGIPDGGMGMSGYGGMSSGMSGDSDMESGMMGSVGAMGGGMMSGMGGAAAAMGSEYGHDMGVGGSMMGSGAFGDPTGAAAGGGEGSFEDPGRAGAADTVESGGPGGRPAIPIGPGMDSASGVEAAGYSAGAEYDPYGAGAGGEYGSSAGYGGPGMGGGTVIHVGPEGVSISMDSFSAPRDDLNSANEILTSFHERYTRLEALHSYVHFDQGRAITQIRPFVRRQQALENELWTRLDDAVSVVHQRELRHQVPLFTGQFYHLAEASSGESLSGSGYPGGGAVGMGMSSMPGGSGIGYGTGPYPGYYTNADSFLPGILGWDSSRYPAVVTIGRQGRWFTWDIAQPSAGNEQGKGPVLPFLLKRFDRQNEPLVVLANLSSVLEGRFRGENESEMQECMSLLPGLFTHRGQLSVVLSILSGDGVAADDPEASAWLSWVQMSVVPALTEGLERNGIPLKDSLQPVSSADGLDERRQQVEWLPGQIDPLTASNWFDKAFQDLSFCPPVLVGLNPESATVVREGADAATVRVASDPYARYFVELQLKRVSENWQIDEILLVPSSGTSPRP